MKIMVTGVSTPLGTALVEALLVDPQVELVLAVGREREPSPVHHPRVIYRARDLTRPRTLHDLVWGEARDRGIDRVIHGIQHRCAADGGPRVHAQNVGATRELMLACLDHPTITRLVYRSFAEIYAADHATSSVLDETAPLDFELDRRRADIEDEDLHSHQMCRLWTGAVARSSLAEAGVVRASRATAALAGALAIALPAASSADEPTERHGVVVVPHAVLARLPSTAEARIVHGCIVTTARGSVSAWSRRVRPICRGLEAAPARRMKALLTLIFVFALGGLAFSGYLTYRELAGDSAVSCEPLGDTGSVLGAPLCVYGFVMYLIIAVIAVIALLVRRHRV